MLIPGGKSSHWKPHVCLIAQTASSREFKAEYGSPELNKHALHSLPGDSGRCGLLLELIKANQEEEKRIP